MPPAHRGQGGSNYLDGRGQRDTVVPPYPRGVPSKTPSGCLKLQIVPNPIYILCFFLYIHTYVSHSYDKI